MDYPVFNVEVETTNDGVWAISLVDAPAVDSEFLLFNKQEKPENKQFNFSIENEEKHNILGCVLRADYPIYRYDSERGEYYLNFSKEVIEKMTAKMLKLGTFKNVDLNHDENYDVEGMSLLQMFIKDSEKGINPVGFEDVADGSLFAVYHVDSFDLWNKIKEGKFNGFSVEAFLTIYEQFNKNNEEPVEEVASEETADTAEENTEEIDVEVELDENEENASEEIEETTEDNNNIVEEDSLIVEAIKEAFSAHNVIETEEGVKIYYVDDEIVVGSKLTDESGNAIGNGEYTINGKTYKVEDGQVTEIIEPADEESNEEITDTTEETASEEQPEETTEPAEEQPEETETVEETTDDITTTEESNEDNSEIETAEGSSNEIATLKATIETLKAEIEALKAEITKPAAPTVEEFSRSGNKGESKAESMLDYLYSIRKH